MKILIAEDDENSRVLLENVLTASGYEVFTAVNGIEALSLLEKQIPDLIISDILMPEMDGYMLCRTIQSDKRFSSIPLVFYTATYTDPKDRQYAMDIGCTSFLVKPMEMDLLLKAIETTLKEHEHSRSARPPLPRKDGCSLEQDYTDVLARKLDKKIKDLEQEREKLRQSEQKYKRIVESLRREYFFYSQNENGVFTYISPSVELILGYSPDDFKMHHDSFLSNHPINGKAREYKKLGMQGKKQPPFEMDFVHKNGTARRIEVSEEPVTSERGGTIFIEGIAQDITQKRKIENRIRQIHKMEALGTLAGGIAHDFNNILTAILGYAEMISADMVPEHRSNVYIDRIYKAGERAKSLISRILTYSRQTEQETEKVRVQDILNEAMKLLRPVLSSIIEIDLNIAPDCSPIQADPTQIHQVIMNLVTNANHAMKKTAGKITINLSEINCIQTDQAHGPCIEPGPHLVLEVRDTGCGICKSDLDNIFDPYFTTKEKGEGTGLGLAMVQSIIAGLGGHIFVETEPGQGTCFILYLPCRKSDSSG